MMAVNTKRTRVSALGLVVAPIYIFLLTPIVMIVIMSFNSGQLLEFPPKGLSFKWFVAVASNESFMRAIKTSVQVALVASAAALLIATPAAIYVVRFSKRSKERLRAIMMLPLMLPEILTAIALLLFLYKTGIGSGSMFGLLIGHTLIVIPYVFTNVSSSILSQDGSLEEAARSLGARPHQVFLRVTLPLMKSGVITGGLFAFIISFDLFNMSLLLKGIGVNTLPLQLFDYLRYDFDPTAAAISTLSILMTFMVLAVVDRFFGLRSVRFGR